VLSLRPLFVVYQSSARVEVGRCDGTADWTTDAFCPDGGIHLPEFGGMLRASDIYARMTF